MKTGMTISCVGHAIALGCALFALSATPMEVPPVDSLPVSFISDKDFTAAHAGGQKRPEAEDRNAEAACRQDRRTEADRSDWRPRRPTNLPSPPKRARPRRSRSPTSKSRSRSRRRRPTPPPPQYKPDQIADLLKKDAPKSPSKPDQAAAAKPDAPKFDANQVAELLDKRDPRRELASNATLNNVANLGSASGAPSAQMSQSEIDALRARISSCWSRRRGSTPTPKFMSCCAFCSNRTALWCRSRCWSRPPPRRLARRSPTAPSARSCCANLSPCCGPTITVSGKTSS